MFSFTFVLSLGPQVIKKKQEVNKLVQIYFKSSLTKPFSNNFKESCRLP